MLRCPHCKKVDLSVLELDNVEIDYCFECSGIWLDNGELELFLGDECSVEPFFKHIREDGKINKKRKCPICRKKMDILGVDTGNGVVVIDRCKSHGYWFDKNELHEIIDHFADDTESKLIKMLRNMFNYKKGGE